MRNTVIGLVVTLNFIVGIGALLYGSIDCGSAIILPGAIGAINTGVYSITGTILYATTCQTIIIMWLISKPKH